MELISPASLPSVDVDVAATRTAADAVRAHAASVTQAGRDLRLIWNGLGDVYDTPEAPTLIARMADVEEASTEFGTAFRRVSGILGELADALAAAEARLRALGLEVDEIRREVSRYRDGVATELAGQEHSRNDGSGAWGPGQYEWNAGLISERERIRGLIEQAYDDADRDLRAIGRPAGVTLTGFAPPANPLARSWQSRQTDFLSALAVSVLERLARGDHADAIRDLVDRRPEWVELLRDHPPDPVAVARWWAGVEPSVAEWLISGASVIVGSLGGVPAGDRVRANLHLATRRREELRAELDKLVRDGPPSRYPSHPHALGGSAAHYTYRQRVEALRREIDYLARVARGDVQLYLYRPERGEIIEMFGDPDTARAIITFLPGTNTTMDSFSSSGELEGVTALTRWQVDNANARVPVAGFVVKQGPFPQLDLLLLATGPQNNDIAEALGASYARFAAELRVIAPRRPVISVEHSFGSAVGGVAETLGARFDSRILLAGIGMTDAYVSDPLTKKYGMQSDNDINRHFDDVQIGNWGYRHAPSAANGIVELDSGMPGTPEWVLAARLVSPPVALAGDLVSGLEQHNLIISGDERKNGVVLREIAKQLEDAGQAGATR